MFGRPRSSRSAWDNASASDSSRAATSEKQQQQAKQLEHWRSSAQRVTREWNAWLAAEGHERRGRYHTFVSALADEERAAAEIQRMA